MNIFHPMSYLTSYLIYLLLTVILVYSNVHALQNHTLQLENEEIPILRDSLEEMKYLESKVVSKFKYSTSVNFSILPQ